MKTHELSAEHNTEKKKKKPKTKKQNTHPPQSKQKECRRKEIIKIRLAINELENKVITQKIN